MADHETIEYIQKAIADLLAATSVQARVEYEDSLSRGLIFNVRSRDAKLLIGHQGSTLHALELLCHAIVNKHFAGQEPVRFSIDVDDYKRNREYNIKQQVKEAVQRIKISGQPVTLPPMPKYERKFVHTYIGEQFPHITTESIGEDPNRKIKLSL
jgi:spoIIIJ-associated protein